MEISYPCIEECLKRLKKYNKCTKKVVAYTISVLEILTLINLLVLCILIPDKVLYDLFYHFQERKRTQIAVIVCTVHSILTCFLLVFGIFKNKSWCVLLWIITMIIYWNANLVASVISIVKYIVEGLEVEREKTTKRTLALFFLQSVWLVSIAYMWYYWKTMKEINNVANLVQYVTERGSSIRVLLRYRRQSTESTGHPVLPALTEMKPSTARAK